MPWARNFCPFRAYWIISSEQVNIVLVVFFTCPNVVMDNQQETFPRRSVVHSCFLCSSPWFAWASKRQYPDEAVPFHGLPKELFIVVKVVQVVFLYVHVLSADECSREALFIVVKVVQVVFLHVHVVSIDFSREAEQALRGSFTGRRGSGR